MLKSGSGVWLPCKVKPGPFPDERMVLVESIDGTKWFGFVNAQWLYLKEQQGEDHVLGTVASVTGNTFLARVPGSAPAPTLVKGRVDQWTPVNDPLEPGHKARASRGIQG